MALNKNEKIKELQAVLLKLDHEYDELGRVLDALEVKKKNATAEEAASIVKEIKQLELDRSKSFKEREEILGQLMILKYRGPNFKYFDLPLEEKVIDEHFKKVEKAGGEWRSEIWEELFDYDYYVDKIANSEVEEEYDFRTKKRIKTRLKQPNLFYYADAFDIYYVDIILALIKRVVKFRFVNGICNTVFYKSSGHPQHDNFDSEFFRLPFINTAKESFDQCYALPLYHLVPKQKIIKLHERHAEYKKEIEERGYPLFYRTEAFKERKERLSDRSTLVDYYVYSCDAFGEYLVNFSAKYFAYNIARFLVKNVAFLPNALTYDSSDFVLFFPDTFNLDPLVSDAIVRETIKHLEQIFASLDVFKANSTISISRFGSGCSCSFSLGRPFKFSISVRNDCFDNLNYPYRSFYMPDCKESDEEFINKIPMEDRLGKLGYVDLCDKNDSYAYRLYPFCWPNNNYTGYGHYILNMVRSEIDYYNLEAKEPFSVERFKQQVEELRKKAAYNSFYDHYSLLIADTAFYQFEKYLEYELEQHKIKNNINYEQMLEERKEKENKFSFFGYHLTVLRKDS